jgi:hypothetical protein
VTRGTIDIHEALLESNSSADVVHIRAGPLVSRSREEGIVSAKFCHLFSISLLQSLKLVGMQP